MSRTPAGCPPQTRHGGKGWWLAVIAVAVALGVVAVSLVWMLRASPGPGTRPSETKALSAWRPADYHSLAFSPTEPDVLYFGHHNGLMRSDDGGRTWRAVKNEANWDAMSLSFPAGESNTVYVAGHDIFYRSRDGGATWEKVQHNLPGTDIHAFTVMPEDPNSVYAFVVGHGLFHSRDGGTTWRPRGEPPPGTMALAAPTGVGDRLLAGTMGQGLLGSEDSGRTWAPAGGGFAGQSVMALGASATTPGLVYAGSERGLFRSTDGGLTWQQLPGVPPVAILAVDPRDGRRLAALDPQRNVLRSDDGGQSWTKVG